MSQVMIKITKKSRKIKWTTVLCYIMLCAAALIVLLPLLWIILQSVKIPSEFMNDSSMLAFPKNFKIKNYYDAIVISKIGEFFLNSVILTFIALVFTMVFCVPVSFILIRYKFFGSGFLFMLISAGMFINVNFIAQPIYLVTARIAKFLHMPGLTSNIITVALIYAVNNCSFAIFLLSGYLRSLPVSYEEAAKIEGCGYWRMLIQVVVPLALPGLITVLLFSFLNYWNEYLLASLFFSSPKKYTIPIGLMATRADDYRTSNFGRLYAGLVIAMLPTIILYCFVQDKLTKGLAAGGLKG